MQSTIEIVDGAKDLSLVTLAAAKIGLNMTTSSQANDDLVSQLISWSSAEIATVCNRVLAQETLTETFRDVGDNTRLFLSHWPVKTAAVEEGGTALTEGVDYELDVQKGRLAKLAGSWSEPVVVTYTGGYDLPFEAPLALQQAALLMTREAYYASLRGDATIRSLSHKEARIMFFDPAQQAKALMGGGGGAGAAGSAARRAIDSLLGHFKRYEC